MQPTLFKWALIVLVTLLVSCSNNDDTKNVPTPVEVTITVEDFSLEMDENPTNGTTLGRVIATTNLGQLQFGLEEEDPIGALRIDSKTGELHVRDSLYFDFETHPKIEAVVKVSNENLSINAAVMITVNDFQNPDYVKMIDLGVNLIERQSIIGLYGNNTFNLVRYYYGNQEIKNGQEYYPFYRQRINYRYTSDDTPSRNSDWVGEPELQYWVREDDEVQKVFMYLENPYNDDFRIDLLYDFSVKAGDTTAISRDYFRFREDPTPMLVESVDSVALTNGEHRKRINLRWYGSMVEGVGLYYRNFALDDNVTLELAYFLKDGELLLDANGDYDPDDWVEGRLPSVDLEKVYQFDGQLVFQSNQSSDGGNYAENNIIENGVCWSSSSPNPTVDDHVSMSRTYDNPYYKNSSSSLGQFYTTIDKSALDPNTTYYVRAYSKNMNGISYSDPVEAFIYNIEMNTERENVETIGDTVHITIKGQVTHNDLPFDASIVEKGIAVDVVRAFAGINLPFPTENSASLHPINEGSLDDFQKTWAINWRNIYDPERPYYHHAFWTYIKLSNGAVIFGNEVQVDVDG